MKLYPKIFIAALSVVALFVTWACGVGMGQANAGRNAEHSKMVDSVIILKAIEEGPPDAAKNWCKTFIVDGNKGRLPNDSVFSSFLHYLRFHERPPLTKSISSKVEEVVGSYAPNIIDLKGQSIMATESGFSVEVPIK